MQGSVSWVDPPDSPRRGGQAPIPCSFLNDRPIPETRDLALRGEATQHLGTQYSTLFPVHPITHVPMFFMSLAG
ncbi:hypothetical protein PG995_009458 [Apiospora arundinis]